VGVWLEPGRIRQRSKPTDFGCLESEHTQVIKTVNSFVDMYCEFVAILYTGVIWGSRESADPQEFKTLIFSLVNRTFETVLLLQ